MRFLSAFVVDGHLGYAGCLFSIYDCNEKTLRGFTAVDAKQQANDDSTIHHSFRLFDFVQNQINSLLLGEMFSDSEFTRSRSDLCIHDSISHEVFNEFSCDSTELVGCFNHRVDDIEYLKAPAYDEGENTQTQRAFVFHSKET